MYDDDRFRSITKQYFRKADGIMVFYDVTSEVSFKNVRNWITSIQEGIEDGTVLMLLGNKVDLLGDSEDGRVITTKDGAKLADVSGTVREGERSSTRHTYICMYVYIYIYI